MAKRYTDSAGQPLYIGDIVLLEVETHQRRLEYVERKMKGFWASHLSLNWCPLPLLKDRMKNHGWKLTKVGNIKENPDYMQGHKVMYLENGPETEDHLGLSWDYPYLTDEQEQIRNEILAKYGSIYQSAAER